jgi:DNA-binding GntR family transcriptional regulator
VIEIEEFSKPKDLKHWAYETIKGIILDGQIEPGGQLRTDDLAQKLKISRTPIREALLQLEGEGLVRANSRVGFFVTETQRIDIQEVYEIRGLIEGYAAEKAAPLLTDADLALIDGEQQAAIDAVARNDLLEFNKHEVALHEFLIKRACNQRLLKMSESLKDLIHRERIYALKSHENIELSLQEHQRLIEALHERDGERAGRCMREHLANVNNRLQALLSQSQNSASDRE